MRRASTESLLPPAATAAPYLFHAFEVSYFSAKVRPALRHKRVWYEELRADLGEVKRRTGLGFIPIVVTPEGETWQDSSEILDALEARHPEPPLYPATPLQRIAALLVELYADEFGPAPAMQWRWGTPEREASSRARFVAMTGSAQAGNGAADAMVRRRDQVGATPEAAAALEAHTHELLAALSAHFEAHPYLLGARMSLADCALMGLVHGHLFTDLESRRLLLERAVPVVGWVERCNVPCSERQGDWLPADALAESLLRVLGVMGRDAAPILLASVGRFERWADDGAALGEEPPRAAGTLEAELRGAPFRWAVRSYTLWMLQRTLDAFAALAPNERERVRGALAGTGFGAALGYAPRHRLGKRDFRLVFEPL
jgi:glutathione S-transferase